MANCREELQGRLSTIDFAAINKFKSRERMYKFDPNQITDDMINSAMSGNPAELIAVFSDRPGLQSKINGLNDSEALTAYTSVFDSIITKAAATGQAITHKELAIATHLIMDALSSEKDVINNAVKHLSALDRKRVDPLFKNSTNDDAVTTPTSRVYSTIGKQVLLSHGNVISKSESYADMEKAYYEIGKSIVSHMGEIFPIVEDGRMVTRGLQDEAGNYINSNKGGIEEQYTTKAQVLSFNYNHPSISKDHQEKTYNQIDAISKALSNAVIPSKEAAPRFSKGSVEFSKLPQEEQDRVLTQDHKYDPSQSDVKVSQETADTISALQATPWKIKPAFAQILKDIRAKYDANKSGSYVRNYAGSVDQSIVKAIFGLDRVNPDDFDADTRVGQMITKTNSLEDVLQNLDKFIDKDGNPTDMFFTYFISRNDRLHQSETVLNYQADKFFTRNILTHGEPQQLWSTEDKDYFVNGLLEDLGGDFTRDDILGVTKNVTLARRLDVIKDKHGNLNTGQIKVVEDIARKPLTKGSVWKEYSMLLAIHDIRASLDANQDYVAELPIRTDYMVESDATASGVLIKLLQEAGRSNSSIMKILGKLGMTDLTSEGIEIDIADVYALMDDAKYSDAEQALGTEPTERQTSDLELDTLKDNARGAMTLLHEYFKARDIVKYPVMKFNYHQKAENVIKEFSREYAEALYKNPKTRKDTLAKIAVDIEAKNIEGIPEQGTTSISEVNYIAQYLQATAGKLLVGIAQDIFTNDVTKESETEMNAIGAELQAIAKASNGKYSMVAPGALELIKARAKEGFDYVKFMKEYSMPMTKRREVVTGKADDGSLLMRNKEMSNPTSMFVNTIHSMDKAILMLAHEKFMAVKENAQRFAGKTPMYIHDAAKGSVAFNREYDQYYREALMEVSREFDVVEAHLMELERAMTFIPEGSPSWIAANKVLGKYKASTAERIAVKRQVLEGKFLPNSFGQLTKGFSIKGQEPAYHSEPAEPIYPDEEEVDTNPPGFEPGEPVHAYKKDVATVIAKFVGDKNQKLVQMLAKMNPAVTIMKTAIDRNNYSPVANHIFLREDATKDQILHEFIHAATIHNIHDESSANVKATARLNKIREQATRALPELSHLWDNKQTHYDKNEEFIAYGLSHPDVIAGLQAQPSLWKSFKDVIARLLGLSQESKDSLYGDLMGVLNSYNRNNTQDKSFKESMSYKYYHGAEYKQSSKDTTQALVNDYKEYKGSKDNIGLNMFGALETANSHVSKMINNQLIPLAIKEGPKLYKAAHEYALANYPIYKTTSDFIEDTWEHNEFFQQLRPYLNMGTTHKAAKEQLEKFMSIIAEAEQKKSHEESAQVEALDKELKAVYSEAEIATLDQIFSRASIAELTASGILGKIADGSTTLSAALKSLSTAATPAMLKQAEQLAGMYVKGEVSDINRKSPKDYYATDVKKENELAQLASLTALNMIPESEKMLTDMFKNNQALYGKMTYYTMAIQSVNKKLHDLTGDTFNGLGNIVEDVYDGSPNIQAISFDELRDGHYPLNRGWKILQEPIEGVQYGIVYNKDQDGSYQAGLGTNISHIKYGLEIKREDKKISHGNFIQNGSKLSLVLTPEQKATLGLVANPAHTLVRTYARLQYAMESNKVRDELLTGTGAVITIKDNNDAQALLDTIKSNKKTEAEGTHPWFITLGDKYTLNTMPPELQKLYKRVENASDIGGFDKKVQLVRIDLASQVMGYREMELFPSVPWMNKASHVIKKLIVMRKIHQVVANPAKLAGDIMSNTVLLAQLGVPLQDIVKHSKEALEGIKEFVELRNEVMLAEFTDNAENTAASKAHLTTLRKKLSNHFLAPAVAGGFVQSMGTDLLHRNYDTVTGLQRDIEATMNKTLKNPSGELNALGKAINGMASFGGFGLDSVVGAVAKQVEGHGKSSDAIARILSNMAKGYKTARESGDPTKYLSQFIAAPDSEIVKAGSGLMQYGDFTARWSLYKHLKNTGVSEKEAMSQALEMFIDYRVNMPKEMKMMSDFGVLMYPTYWARVQKVIALATAKSPVTAGTSIVLESLFNGNIPSIYNSNIITKAMSWNGIINSPLDVFSADTLIPSHLLP